MILPAKCKLGHAMEASPDPIVNQLEQKPDDELTEEEASEWRAFIIKNLKLDENELLKNNPKAREEVIQIFMDNRAALAVNDHDYGLTKLMKFDIKLEPGARPMRAKVRPLNPIQEAGLRQQLDQWLEAGVIEDCLLYTSPSPRD